MGIGGAYRNSFKMAVYLCPSVVWSFPAEVGWTHIPRRCSKNSWSWTGWRWIAWSREESGSREVNSSGRNPAVRKLRKWSEFSIYWRASFVLSVNLTPNMTFFIFFPLKLRKGAFSLLPSFRKREGVVRFVTHIHGFFPQTERASLSPTPPPSSTPTNTRVIRITLGKLNINYFYVIKKMGFFVTVPSCGGFIRGRG